MDSLLEHAKALFIDRQRIALSALIISAATTFYVFYSPGIIGLMPEPPEWFPSGASLGFEVIASFNTIGFFLAFSIMVFFYGLWQWAFLPAPAYDYTIMVLKGILGSKARISYSFGKRFRINMPDGTQFFITCKIKEPGSDEWFSYRLISTPINNPRLRNIALRHGIGVKENRLTTWVSNDELHSMIIQFLKALDLSHVS